MIGHCAQVPGPIYLGSFVASRAEMNALKTLAAESSQVKNLLQRFRL
jgi:hypothetical protein